MIGLIVAVVVVGFIGVAVKLTLIDPRGTPRGRVSEVVVAGEHVVIIGGRPGDTGSLEDLSRLDAGIHGAVVHPYLADRTPGRRDFSQ